MKPILLFLIAIVLMPAALRAQALPDAPAPAPPPDPAWARVRSLNPGQPIVVLVDNGPPVHCLFTGATEAYLFCSPAGNPPGVGYRFDRGRVAGVDLDLPARNSAQFEQPQPNYHPAWIASMIGGGLITGLVATRSMDAGDAARIGLIGALVVGAIGVPLAFLPQPGDGGLAFRPHRFAHARLPRTGPHPLPRLARIR